jgi:hypothetical protein
MPLKVVDKIFIKCIIRLNKKMAKTNYGSFSLNLRQIRLQMYRKVDIFAAKY